MNLKELLFGQRKRVKSGNSDDEAKINYLTGQPYSSKYYSLLEVRKRLPAWAAKQ